MKNVDLSITGNVLTITVDMSKEFGPSASGKTTIIAQYGRERDNSRPGREDRVEYLQKESLSRRPLTLPSPTRGEGSFEERERTSGELIFA